jgi:3-methyladenine DNA glycosylase Tag
MTPFKTIRARAEKRKGGPKALEKLMPEKPDLKGLAERGDDRILAEMTRRVFCAGFAWSVIETKWDGFEDAFLRFQPAKLTFQPEDYWEGLLRDARIVRNGAKIMSVRDNAAFVQEIAREHGSFGRFLAKWPPSDQIGLLDLLSKRGSRLGGNTGQMLLRFVGWDGFVTSRDVVACLRDAGLDIAEEVKSKGDLAKVQRSSTPGPRRPGCLTHICHASVHCPSARTEAIIRSRKSGEQSWPKPIGLPLIARSRTPTPWRPMPRCRAKPSKRLGAA